MVIFRIELHVRILSHAGQVLADRGDAMGSKMRQQDPKIKFYTWFFD